MPPSSKRARVMSRSRKLGHCICDPRKPCPCPLFLEKNVCTCAGERVQEHAASGRPIALTKLVKNAGCASKIPPAELARILAQLPVVQDPRLLVGLGTADDAGVIRISDDLALVQTVDVFAPSVDDPFLFGQIAVCNSLSDVYAMGGAPTCALSIISYPIHTLSDEYMIEMLRGAADKLAEAGVLLAGGHSINGDDILFGFAVSGVIKPDAIITNAGARPGDTLILTKPIGTGVIAFAAQIGRAAEEHVRAAAQSMATLNRAAAQVMQAAPAHACTDVTGFGLLGHLYNLVKQSGMTAELWPEVVPTFPGVLEYAEADILSGAVERNREFAAHAVECSDAVSEHALDVLYDPQTSGGLLIAVASDVAQRTLADLHAAGCPDATVVGRIVEPSEGRIQLTRGTVAGTGPAQPQKENEEMADSCSQPNAQPSEEKPCCAADTSPAPAADACCASAGAPAATEPAAPEQAFRLFMGKAFAPGALDVIQKEITTIALAVAVQCEDCLTIHLEKARGMGISAQELEEAAWLGIAFGGCKAMMFWQRMSR